MAKIPLRAYFREIEGLIEHGQLEEATTHCKHVLQAYPKLIAAYRLLGKAYLEDQRYGDAADIFQRVLSSVPDDFVSHVGMSIIREDEGNLDAAIWHMERAFEVQPYNAAIQDELRRLFQRRDGVEPHKIRLTRAALARMYAKGDLYQQAIAELRAAQTEDAQRPDLQILLARMYYLNGMLVEAVEMCSTLIKKLPYCLEANRLLATILPQTERKDEAKIYQQRVTTLDPYIAAAPITTVSSDSVAENVAVIEKLDFRPAAGAQTTTQPAWAASLGVSLEGFTSTEEPLPDWMKAGGPDTPQPAEAGQEPGQESPATSKLPWETPSELGAGIPDWMSSGSLKGAAEPPGSKVPAITGSLIPNWMKEAGWEPGSGAGEDSPSEPTPPSESEPTGTGIVQAELPDWLRAMAPPTEQEEAPREEGNLPWDQETLPGSRQELPSWLADMKEEEPASPPPAPAGPAGAALPDWLQSIGEEPPSAGEAGEEQPTVFMAGETRPEKMEEQGLEAEKAKAPSAPETPAPESAEAGLGFDLSDQDAALAWLETLAAKQGASEEELITRPEERSKELRSWMQEASQPPAPPEPGVPPADLQAEPGEEWLPEQPLSPEAEQPNVVQPALPAEEAETALPDWLAGALEEEKPALQAEREGQEAGPAADLPDWLRSAMERAPSEVETSQGSGAETQAEIPDWLRTLSEEPAREETEAMEASTTFAEQPAAEPALEIPDWLATLSKPAGGEAAVEEPAVEASAAPAEEPAAEPAIEIPDWLATLAEPAAGMAASPAESEPLPEPQAQIQEIAPQAAAPETTEAAASFDLSDQDAALAWLESLAVKQGVSEEELITRPEDRTRDLPAWLKESEKPTVPVDETPQVVSSEVPVEEADLADTHPFALKQLQETEQVSQAAAPPPEQAPQAVESPPAPEETPAGKPWQPAFAAEAEPIQEQPAEEPLLSGEMPPAMPVEELVELWPVQSEEQPIEIIQEAAAEPEAAILAEPVSEEPVLAEQKPAEITQVEAVPAMEPEPELPTWIAEIAAGKPEEEEYAWMPPAIAAEAALAETAPQVEPEPEAQPAQEPPIPSIPPAEKTPAIEELLERQININTASLIELENLPGVGFIQAQNILAHRDAHGPFNRIEDLLNVPGFNPAVLEELHNRLTTGAVEKPAAQIAYEELEPEAVDPDQAVLIQARNALIQENVSETVARYTHLIKRQRMLETVIRDLYEALYHFPTDVSIWQTLGDAYMRNNQHQEALDAYIKAEEILR